MNFSILVDMNLAPDWIPVLVAAGHNAVHWSTVGAPTALDSDLMDWARTNDQLILTHDLDSAEGLRNLVTWFLPLEEAVGARSTSFVVPCAWSLDVGLLDETSARGHELGVHYVLEGSVRRAGSQVRINVQLVDAESGAIVSLLDKPLDSSNNASIPLIPIVWIEK